MRETELLRRGSRDSHAEFRKLPGLPCHEFETEVVGVDHHETVAAVSGVDLQSAQSGYVEWQVEGAGKRRYVAYAHRADFPAVAAGRGADQSAGRFQ